MAHAIPTTPAPDLQDACAYVRGYYADLARGRDDIYRPCFAPHPHTAAILRATHEPEPDCGVYMARVVVSYVDAHCGAQLHVWHVWAESDDSLYGEY